VDRWFSNKPYLSVLRVEHSTVLAKSREESDRIAKFVGVPMNIDAMSQQVERSLYRERAGTVSATER
jgi:hypothetical protein